MLKHISRKDIKKGAQEPSASKEDVKTAELQSGSPNPCSADTMEAFLELVARKTFAGKDTSVIRAKLRDHAAPVFMLSGKNGISRVSADIITAHRGDFSDVFCIRREELRAAIFSQFVGRTDEEVGRDPLPVRRAHGRRSINVLSVRGY